MAALLVIISEEGNKVTSVGCHFGDRVNLDTCKLHFGLSLVDQSEMLNSPVFTVVLKKHISFYAQLMYFLAFFPLNDLFFLSI